MISIDHATKRVFSIFKCFFELLDINLIYNDRLQVIITHESTHMWPIDPEDSQVLHAKQIDCTNTAFYHKRNLLSGCLIIIIKTSSKYLWQATGLYSVLPLTRFCPGHCFWTKLPSNQAGFQVTILGLLLLNSSTLSPSLLLLKSLLCAICSFV